MTRDHNELQSTPNHRAMDLPANSDLEEHHDELSAQEMYNLVSSVISVIH